MEPTDAHRETLDRHHNIYRRVYNHFRYQFNEHDDVSDKRKLRDELPDLKRKFPVFKIPHSRALQKVVERLYDNLDSLKELKAKGYEVGSLNCQPTTEVPIVHIHTIRLQARQEGRSDYATPLEDQYIPLVYHREVPDDATLKEVYVKQEPIGKWFTSVVVDDGIEKPQKPDGSSEDMSSSFLSEDRRYSHHGQQRERGPGLSA